MPTEVLSYYLKNKDRKVRLGFQVILQCAPFLKGLKVSGLISMENESYSELEEMFSGMEINFYKLSCSEGKCLVLFYRPRELGRIYEPAKTLRTDRTNTDIRKAISRKCWHICQNVSASVLHKELDSHMRLELFSDIRRQMCRALLKKKAEILL